MKRVKVGWTVDESIVKVLTEDQKLNGRSPGWHIDQALTKHLTELGLIKPVEPSETVWEGECTCTDNVNTQRGRDAMRMHDPSCKRRLVGA